MRLVPQGTPQSSIDEFIKKAQPSSGDTLQALQKLVDDLQNPSLRASTRRFLTDLQIHLEASDNPQQLAPWFHLDRLALGSSEGEDSPLVLMQLPSIFTPEDWSFTFYEGLARYPTSEFAGKVCAELGCGNGWISLALAQKALPQKIYGLDINPKAILCAKINLYLNGLHSDGSEKWDLEGRSLLDRVEFLQSDLLGALLEKNVTLDRVVGCIPQVLSPDEEFSRKLEEVFDSDDFLYSLSNYCSKQGYVEDQFGLGLIARAVEESVAILRPGGRIVMNLGGRPGKAILERLFTRRGLQVKTVWSTKVEQASDTDIQPLVDIERSTGHRFEFYMGTSATEPVSATTAQAYAQAGGAIAHALSVSEAEFQNPQSLRKVLKTLSQKGFERARSALDLAHKDPSLQEERLSFLSRLSDALMENEPFPYDDTLGSRALRRRTAEFLRSYHKVPLSAKNIAILPARQNLVTAVLRMYDIRSALIDAELMQHCRLTPGLQPCGELTLYEAPRRAELAVELLKTMRCQAAFLGLAPHENPSSDTLARLSEQCYKLGTRLFLDISPYVELQSQPAEVGALRHISQTPLAPHVSLFFGLLRNRVDPELQLAVCVSENEEFLEALAVAAELDHSRTPIHTQLYYDVLFYELLNFQVQTHRRSGLAALRSPQPETGAPFPPLSNRMKPLLTSPCFQEHHSGLPAQVTRLDYGENALPTPDLLRSSLLEAFVSQELRHPEQAVARTLASWVERRMGAIAIPSSHLFENWQDHLLLAGGVSPLFSALLRDQKERGRKLLFPTGAYGYFQAAAQAEGTDHLLIPTEKANGFKWSVQILQQALTQNAGPCTVFLNAPVVNPTGALYSPAEIQAILDICRQKGAEVILDSIFSGLEFEAPTPFPLLGRTAQLPVLWILGGIAKEWAAGGLRCGWLWTPEAGRLKHVSRWAGVRPHPTLLHAVHTLLSAWLQGDPLLLRHAQIQREILSKRAQKLSQVLESTGWSPLPSQGGLFLTAAPTRLLGKKCSGETLTEANIAHHLLHQTGLLINGPDWTGIPGHCRFVLSTTESVFEKALQCLESFCKKCQESI